MGSVSRAVPLSPQHLGSELGTLTRVLTIHKISDYIFNAFREILEVSSVNVRDFRRTSFIMRPGQFYSEEGLTSDGLQNYFIAWRPERGSEAEGQKE